MQLLALEVGKQILGSAQEHVKERRRSAEGREYMKIGINSPARYKNGVIIINK